MHVKFTKAKTGRPLGDAGCSPPSRSSSRPPSLGTQRLLHRMKDEGHLPRLSRPARLPVAHQLRVDPRRDRARHDTVDYSQGVAITSSFHPDEDTHIEPVRYGKGSNVMALMQTVLTDGDGPEPRWRTWLQGDVDPARATSRDLYDLKHWSERTVIALVMQTLDNSITTYTKRIPGTRKRLPDLASRATASPNPTWIPVGNEAVRRMAKIMGGTPGGSIGEPFNLPLTAHFIGGCAIGDSPGDRRDRPLPAGLRPPRPARRRRLGDLGQPRREPVADDHRPGRAGDGVLAQQGRAGPAARRSARRTGAIAPVGPGRPRGPGRRARARCGCRSSASADLAPVGSWGTGLASSMICAMGEQVAARDATLRPLSTMGWGLLLVIFDVRLGVDFLPDPLGWLMALVAAASLSRLHGAFRVVAAACGLGLVASVPDWVGIGGAAVAIATTVAETLVVFATCTAIMALVPERRGRADALRWWDLGLTLALAVLSAVATEQPDLGVLAVAAGIADLVVFVCFVVLLFGAAKATPTGPGKTIRTGP